MFHETRASMHCDGRKMYLFIRRFFAGLTVTVTVTMLLLCICICHVINWLL